MLSCNNLILGSINCPSVQQATLPNNAHCCVKYKISISCLLLDPGAELGWDIRNCILQHPGKTPSALCYFQLFIVIIIISSTFVKIER